MKNPSSKHDGDTPTPTHAEAAICGLYCGNCPSFGHDCLGCLSSRVAEDCRTCSSGFRACAEEKHVARCFECDQFPCKRLEDFSKVHIVNGVRHHERVIQNLREMRESGIDEWLRRMDVETRCAACGHRRLWYEISCVRCSPGKP